MATIDLLQDFISQISFTIESECGVIDKDGFIIGCTSPNKLGCQVDTISAILKSSNDVISINDVIYQKVYVGRSATLIIYIHSNNPNDLKYLKIMSAAVHSIGCVCVNKYNKLSFIKSVLANNILPGDIAIKANKLQIEPSVNRVVLTIKFEGVDFSLAERIFSELFPDTSKDYVVYFDSQDAALVKALSDDDSPRQVHLIPYKILSAFPSDNSEKIIIGLGNIVSHIKDISKSLREAQVALSIGRMFDSTKNVFSYAHLGIGRLIYQLPTTLCELFLKEVFGDSLPEELDNETLDTIERFFEHSLNVSETARKLFIHRNTLVYRLDKIQKITGLDLRMFDDAITFKVAVMVKKYLEAGR